MNPVGAIECKSQIENGSPLVIFVFSEFLYIYITRLTVLISRIVGYIYALFVVMVLVPDVKELYAPFASLILISREW